MKQNPNALSKRVYYRLTICKLLKLGILNRKLVKFFKLPKIESELFELNLLVHNSAVCVDVGANVGMYTVVLSKIVGRYGYVLAFEPSEVTFHHLSRCITGPFVRLTNVKIFNKALGERNAKVSLIYHRENNGGISDPLTRVSAIPGNTEMRTLDSVYSEMGLERLDFIKVDVEGYEHNVLLGSVEVLSKYHPTILMEIDNKWLFRYSSKYESIRSFLENYGYEPFTIKKGSLTKIEGDYQGNIIFLWVQNVK